MGAMQIVLIKADGVREQDRAYLEVDGAMRRAPVHVVHDLPHLVVESLFGISEGLWGELAAGAHEAAGRAVTARDPKRQKQGRIVSGAAAGTPTEEWLTPGHRAAKTVTNCVANRWGDGPDTPEGVRERVAHQDDPAARELLSGVDDDTIATAIRGVRVLEQRWVDLAPGGTLRLLWPLPFAFFETARRADGRVQR